MSPARPRRRAFAFVQYEGGRAAPPVAIESRDVPSAWRRAERAAKGASFALYDPDGALVRVGVAPPPALATPLAATAVALSADGETVITGHESGALRAHDARTGVLRWERTAASSRIDCIVVPARASWVVACARSGEVSLVDCAAGRPLFQVTDEEARAIALAPDDKTLAVAGSAVELWSVPEGVRVALLDADVAVARQRRAAAAADDGADDDQAAAVEGPEGICHVAFAAGGQRVVGARSGEGGELIVWDRAEGRRVVARAMPVARMAITRDGARAAVGTQQGGMRVRMLDLGTLAQQCTHESSAERVLDLRMTQDDRFVLLQDDEAGVHVIDPATGLSRACLDDFAASAYALGRPRSGSGDEAPGQSGDGGFSDEPTHVVALPRWRRDDPGAPLSRDGRRYAVLRRRHDQSIVPLFDLTTCRPYAALSHARPAAAVWLNNDGTRVVTRDSAGRVYIWSVPDVPATLAG